MIAHARSGFLKFNQCLLIATTFSISCNDPYIQDLDGLSQLCCEVLKSINPFHGWKKLGSRKIRRPKTHGWKGKSWTRISDIFQVSKNLRHFPPSSGMSQRTGHIIGLYSAHQLHQYSLQEQVGRYKKSVLLVFSRYIHSKRWSAILVITLRRAALGGQS